MSKNKALHFIILSVFVLLNTRAMHGQPAFQTDFSKYGQVNTYINPVLPGDLEKTPPLTPCRHDDLNIFVRGEVGSI